MENIRCLIADIPHIILADIIQQITEKRPGIEVVGCIDNNNDLSQVVKDRAIDVLISGMEVTSASQSLNKVFEISPQVVAVGVVDDGRRICVCVEDIGPDDLVELVKVAVQNRHNDL